MKLQVVRLFLLLGWALAAVGFYGPWIAHETAALTLSGVDMGEFVKFLPTNSSSIAGTSAVIRQLFYLPPVAVVCSVALLIGSRHLGYPWLLRVLALALAVPFSLQLLPPAWSPASLMTTEFRLQTITLGICWLLLAGFWLLARLPALLAGLLAAVLSLAAIGLAAWQLALVKPAIDQVYQRTPDIGWGFWTCAVGLAVMAGAAVVLALRARQRRDRRRWSGQLSREQ